MQDGHIVPAGKILATQRTTRFHPGLNVRKNNLLSKSILYIFTDIFSKLNIAKVNVTVRFARQTIVYNLNLNLK